MWHPLVFLLYSEHFVTDAAAGFVILLIMLIHGSCMMNCELQYFVTSFGILVVFWTFCDLCSCKHHDIVNHVESCKFHVVSCRLQHFMTSFSILLVHWIFCDVCCCRNHDMFNHVKSCKWHVESCKLQHFLISFTCTLTMLWRIFSRSQKIFPREGGSIRSLLRGGGFLLVFLFPNAPRKCSGIRRRRRW